MPEFNISMALKVSFPAPTTKQKNHVDHCSLVQTEKFGYRCFHEGNPAKVPVDSETNKTIYPTK